VCLSGGLRRLMRRMLLEGFVEARRVPLGGPTQYAYRVKAEWIGEAEKAV